MPTDAAAPPKARGRHSGVAVVVLGAGAFVAASLLPWRHLVGAGYAARFLGFTVALGVAALLLQQGLARGLRGRGALAGVLASLVVYLPVWLWNGRSIDVVMLHLDSLRAASCSSYGYERETTPRIDAFARERGVLFERFFSQSGGTDKSTPAMLAGIYPSMFYDPWNDGHNYLVPDRFPLLGEHLAEHGYRGLAVSSNPQVSLQRNYGRGFHLFEEIWEREPRPAELAELMQRRMAEVEGPLFYFGLWIDPHLPYTPRPRFDVFSAPGSPPAPALFSEAARRLAAGEAPDELPEELVAGLVDAYDGEILEVDAAVGALVDWLEDAGRLDRTMLVVTADHGEKFGEHGELGHGGTPFDEVVHVPLVWSFPSPLRFPELRPRHRVYSGLCSHVDLVPTILGFLGVDAADGMAQGRDLTPWLYHEDEPLRQDVLVEELVDGLAIRCLRSADRTAIQRVAADGNRTETLWDVTASPEARIAEGERARLAEMVAELERRVQRLQGFYREKPDEQPLDAETLEHLRSLGYVR